MGTAVLSVLDRLVVQVNDRLVFLTVLLDPSVAFDMLDDSIFLKRLHVTFKVQGTSLE